MAPSKIADQRRTPSDIRKARSSPCLLPTSTACFQTYGLEEVQGPESGPLQRMDFKSGSRQTILSSPKKTRSEFSVNRRRPSGSLPVEKSAVTEPFAGSNR